MKQRNFQMIKTNGVTLYTVVEGNGPLVILLHGFQQCWYLWRHQIDPLVAAGFQVAVLDRRGYDNSDKPVSIEAYNIVDLKRRRRWPRHRPRSRSFHRRRSRLGRTGRMAYRAASSRASGRRGRDVRAVCAGKGRRTDAAGKFRRQLLVHRLLPNLKLPRELEADVRKTLRMVYYCNSGDAPEGLLLKPKPVSAKLLDGFIDPPSLPSWLTAEHLDYYVTQFEKSGFRGPLNWYRNIDRNIEITPELEHAKIEQPAFFIAEQNRFSALLRRRRMARRNGSLRSRPPRQGHHRRRRPLGAGRTSPRNQRSASRLPQVALMRKNASSLQTVNSVNRTSEMKECFKGAANS
jgi:pimeloyl-ACP methyl ester carboxylesterase